MFGFNTERLSGHHVVHLAPTRGRECIIHETVIFEAICPDTTQGQQVWPQCLCFMLLFPASRCIRERLFLLFPSSRRASSWTTPSRGHSWWRSPSLPALSSPPRTYLSSSARQRWRRSSARRRWGRTRWSGAASGSPFRTAGTFHNSPVLPEAGGLCFMVQYVMFDLVYDFYIGRNLTHSK